MNEVIASYNKSLKRLEEILAQASSEMQRDATIQRFEFTVELAWKSLQVRLRQDGIRCRSPKDCLQAAFEQGLISDDESWFRLMEDRNLTVHTYNEATAEEVYSRIPSYLSLFKELAVAFSARK